jgi:hypothetical protein
MGNLEKLKTFIKNINIIREEDVVYLFVLIRKIVIKMLILRMIKNV